jgi:hypothetical protein
LVLRKENCNGEGAECEGWTTACSTLDALDDIEPELRHLYGLVAAFRMLGDADDAIEPVAVSSLARSAGETLEEIERNWRIAIATWRGR